MKHTTKIVAMVALIVLALTACGKETFSCGWCGNTVTQSPHKMEIAGDSMKICDSCYADLKEAGVGG